MAIAAASSSRHVPGEGHQLAMVCSTVKTLYKWQYASVYDESTKVLEAIR